MNADQLDPSLLERAILAYVGKGKRRTPGSDADAVRLLAPSPLSDALLAEVVRVVAVSDSIDADWADAVDGSLFPVFRQRMSELCPGLTEVAMRALSWRWAYLSFY